MEIGNHPCYMDSPTQPGAAIVDDTTFLSHSRVTGPVPGWRTTSWGNRQEGTRITIGAGNVIARGTLSNPTRRRDGLDYCQKAKIPYQMRRLAEVGAEVIVRVPVIPGFNDSPQQMERIADFLYELGPPVIRVNLLPFHNWCQDKYRWLRRDWEYRDVESMAVSEISDLQDILEERGLATTIGG